MEVILVFLLNRDGDQYHLECICSDNNAALDQIAKIDRCKASDLSVDSYDRITLEGNPYPTYQLESRKVIGGI